MNDISLQTALEICGNLIHLEEPLTSQSSTKSKEIFPPSKPLKKEGKSLFDPLLIVYSLHFLIHAYVPKQQLKPDSVPGALLRVERQRRAASTLKSQKLGEMLN